MANKELIGELKEAMEMWIEIFLKYEELHTAKNRKKHAQYFNWIGRLKELLTSGDINVLGVDDSSEPEDIMSNIEDLKMFKKVIQDGAHQSQKKLIYGKEKIEELEEIIGGKLNKMKLKSGDVVATKLKESGKDINTILEYQGLNETKLNEFSLKKAKGGEVLKEIDEIFELILSYEDMVLDAVKNKGAKRLSDAKELQIKILKDLQKLSIYKEVKTWLEKKIEICARRARPVKDEDNNEWLEIGTNIFAKIDETSSDISDLDNGTLDLFKDALLNGIIAEKGTGQSGVKIKHDPPQIKVRRTKLEALQEATDLRITGTKVQKEEKCFVTFDGVGHGH